MLPYPFPTGSGEPLDATAAIALAIALLGFAGAIFAFGSSFLTWRRLRAQRQASTSAVPLEEKMVRISELSLLLGSLNKEVQAEFELQIAATQKAKEDAEHAKALASLNDEQRAAAERLVGAQVEQAFATNGKRDRRFQFWLSFFSFVAGVIASIVVTLAFSSLTPAEDRSREQPTSQPSFEHTVDVALDVL